MVATNSNSTDPGQIYEIGRLAALERTELLDTEPEPEFNELVEIAAAICGASMCVISLVDEKRQWFKAAFGMDTRETEREISFCQYTIQQDGLFKVTDATQDPRFVDNPLVTGEMHLRFYAGFPVSSPDGFPLGSLCVLDKTPHDLTDAQQTALHTLARQVNARIELRMQRRALQRALSAVTEAHTKAEASDRRFKAFINSGPFFSFLKDREGRLLFYNQKFADRFHIGPTDWLGVGNDARHPEELAAAVRDHDLQVLTSGCSKVFLEESLNEDGSTSYWRSYKFPCPDEDGEQMLGVVTVEVTEELRRTAELERSRNELEAANRLLRELATTDSLTGLPNRRVFDERLQFEYATARRKKRNLSVLMVDVDNFKMRNDTYGHDHGDQILRQLAKCLRNAAREGDLPARFGGEEFCYLLPECDEQQALIMCKRIAELLRAETWEHGTITVSIGAAGLEPATPNAQRLVTLADEALYAAKRAGKNRAVGYRTYYQQMLEELSARTPRR